MLYNIFVKILSYFRTFFPSRLDREVVGKGATSIDSIRSSECRALVILFQDFSGLILLGLLFAFDCRDAGKSLAFDSLKKGAAACRDIADSIGAAELVDTCYGITTAYE